MAPTDELKKAFGHADVDKIVLDILNNGEIQLSEKERQAKASQISNEIYQIVSAKCVNPKTKKRYPPTMIQKALNELNFNPVSNKPAKIQALEAIKLLTQRQLIPISRAKMKLKLTLESREAQELKEQFAKMINTIEKETWNGNWECIAFIDPVNYRQIVELMAQNKAKSHIEVLDMAVIKEGDSEF